MFKQKDEILKYINVNHSLHVPKYIQVVESIVSNVRAGKLVVGQRIPSINMVSEELYLSRDTVEKAYKKLKEQNTISSIRGKGFYIQNTELNSKIKIQFIMNKLSDYKMKVYNSFLKTIGPDISTELSVYHGEESLFLNLLNNNKTYYDFYVIMLHFNYEKTKYRSITDEVSKLINKIPSEKIILLDNVHLVNNKEFKGIYQDFKNDIYNALTEASAEIEKYNRIILVFPSNALYPYPKQIMYGFIKYCEHHIIDYVIVSDINKKTRLKEGDLYITIEDSDLITLLKLIAHSKFSVANEIGVISYNDTPLKELLGITVISTNFILMGKTAAEMIINNKRNIIKNPFYFIQRNSI